MEEEVNTQPGSDAPPPEAPAENPTPAPEEPMGTQAVAPADPATLKAEPEPEEPTDGEIASEAFAELQAALDHLKTSSNANAPYTIVFDVIKKFESGLGKLKKLAGIKD